MSRQMVYIESDSNDPAYNLALEQYVFEELPRDRDYFWLWQNKNAIIVGKYQNTSQEINQEYVNAHGIQVVRRLSGGGTVYHDMGNVNFTFIADAGELDKLNLQMFCEPVVETLKNMGVDAQLSGRNDISIDGQKFSGNSQYIKNGRIMHHGTLMFDSDLSVVSSALRVSEAKYKSKGFPSVRSRVTNIRPHIASDMTMETFKQTLKENILHAAQVQIYRPTQEDREEILQIKRERYDTWEWNYGRSPEYAVTKKVRVEGCGQLEVCMNVTEGKIEDIDCFGDFFGEGITEELRLNLRGCRLRREDLRERLAEFDLENCFAHLDVETWISILTEK